MPTKIWISEIIFSDDSTLEFKKGDIVVLVGPNNAGKSASLKEAAAFIKAKKQKGKVLKDIKIEKEGDESDLFVLLEKSATKNYDNPSQILYKVSDLVYGNPV